MKHLYCLGLGLGVCGLVNIPGMLCGIVQLPTSTESGVSTVQAVVSYSGRSQRPSAASSTADARSTTIRLADTNHSSRSVSYDEAKYVTVQRRCAGGGEGIALTTFLNFSLSENFLFVRKFSFKHTKFGLEMPCFKIK